MVLGLVALALAVLVSVAVGSKQIPLDQVWQALTGAGLAEDRTVIFELRLPRTLIAIAVGAALGVAGMLMQALTRNPLADPGILGVNSGAMFAVALGVGFFGASSMNAIVWCALIGAFLAAVAVYAVGSAGRSEQGNERLTLAGVALGAVLAGVTSALILSDATTFDQLRVWQAGSVAGRLLSDLTVVVPFLLVGAALALVASGPLNAIALGDDVARGLGTRVGLVRVIVVLAVTLLAGGATAIAGPVAFIGLMTPHIARWIVGVDQRWILVMSMICAALLMVASDVVGRVIARPQEIPVGIVTAFVGAPVLMVLVRRRRASAS
ncbi:iron chelate uptake ABC transporter family permease subunit [Epidermidibacterium keratini]